MVTTHEPENADTTCVLSLWDFRSTVCVIADMDASITLATTFSFPSMMKYPLQSCGHSFIVRRASRDAPAATHGEHPTISGIENSRAALAMSRDPELSVMSATIMVS